MDRFTPFPEEGWPRWMANQLEQAQFVIIVATEAYAKRFAGHAPASTGLGATWEGAIIMQDLYEAGARNKKFLPAIFSGADADHIPNPLQPFTYFRVDTNNGYDALYRQISGQPEIVPAALGSVRAMPGGVGAMPAEDTPTRWRSKTATRNTTAFPRWRANGPSSPPPCRSSCKGRTRGSRRCATRSQVSWGLLVVG